LGEEKEGGDEAEGVTLPSSTFSSIAE